jgi:hypothetical protein
MPPAIDARRDGRTWHRSSRVDGDLHLSQVAVGIAAEDHDPGWLGTVSSILGEARSDLSDLRAQTRP